MPKILTSSMFADCQQVWDIVCRVEASPIGQAMKATVEDSPYHREENTWVHTEMVLEQYLTRFYHHRNEHQNRVALLALLAHDFGKPSAEETLEKKDGSGTYRRYAGHEQDSAVAFTECWLKDPVLREFVSVDEARQIRWIIEHHLPYGLKDGKKRSDLRTAMEHTLRDDVETFYDCLRSDAAGRISDDHETKLASVEEWIREFRTVPLAINKYNVQMGKCYVMVGPSGSGKSTWIKQYLRMCDRLVSRDEYYLDYFHSKVHIGFSTPDAKKIYADAWHLCCIEDKAGFEEFLRKQVADRFHDAQRNGGSVFIDNTNGGKKARAFYIQAARNIGMKVVAVEFWNTFETLLARQSSRPDKFVPEKSLKQQYFIQTCAWLGSEVDEVIVVPGT